MPQVLFSAESRDVHTKITMIHRKIVIIGAGMAGLGAAYALSRNGFTDFLVVEALEGPGGRIRTIPVGDGVVELGAQWVHGVDTALYDLAKRKDLIHAVTSDEGGGIYVRDDGRIVDDWLVRKVDFRVGKILEECEGFVDAVEHPRSVGEFLRGKFADFAGEDEDLWELYDWHERFQLIDNCCDDLEELSAREWGRYSCLGKDGQAHVNLRGGYGALVAVLVHELPEGAFRFNCAVNRITLDQGKLKLECRGGVDVTAEHAVVTASLGALKRHRGFLGVPLPSEVAAAVEKMGFGGMGKVFLVFGERWWKGEGFQLVWRRGSTAEVGWTRCISGFDPVLDQPNVLLGWVSAVGVEEMEATSEELVGIQCVDLLRRFLPNQDIPYPEKTYKSSWGSCEWIGGGYSHTTPACDAAGVGASTLGRAVCFQGVPRMVFAGEAAHPAHFSTTHGAFESGVEQATKILTYIREKQQKVIKE